MCITLGISPMYIEPLWVPFHPKWAKRANSDAFRRPRHTQGRPKWKFCFTSPDKWMIQLVGFRGLQSHRLTLVISSWHWQLLWNWSDVKAGWQAEMNERGFARERNFYQQRWRNFIETFNVQCTFIIKIKLLYVAWRFHPWLWRRVIMHYFLCFWGLCFIYVANIPRG
jgi:hypothetical protein